MEEMKTFECSICGKKYNNLKDRINCETKCLAEQEKMEKLQKEDIKKKKEQEIKEELRALDKQYNKVSSMINDYYEKYYPNTRRVYKALDDILDIIF